MVFEDEEERERMRLLEGEREVDLSSDELSSDDENEHADRKLGGRDIPIVRDLKYMDEGESKTEKQLTKEDDNFGSHFTVNPVLEIKRREAKKKRLIKKRAENLKKDRGGRYISDSDDDDLVFEKSTRKFHIKDLGLLDNITKPKEKVDNIPELDKEALRGKVSSKDLENLSS